MAQTFANRRALVVDDEFLIAFDMEESMRELGFEVCSVAPNVEKAIRLAVTNQPEVVLMDVYLGGAHEGIEAGRWLMWRVSGFCHRPQRRRHSRTHS
jgi:AmiR/NasT family two-component response regulator